MTTAPDADGPIASRIALGRQLRQLRQERRITHLQAAEALGCSPSKISRLERGLLSFKERDVHALLSFYGVGATQTKIILNSTQSANVRGWWRPYSDIMPSWFGTYIGLESTAAQIRTYESHLIPGLLQTQEYARAIAASVLPRPTDGQISRKVALRMQRQQVIARPGATTLLWAVIDESALLRRIGGNRVMRHQLEHLLTMQRAKNIMIQIMPLRTGGHAGECGPFSILRPSDRTLPDVVYLEDLTGARYLDRASAVERYHAAFDQLVIGSPRADRVVQKLLPLYLEK